MKDAEVARIGTKIATALRKFREDAGVSKNALAQRAGVSVQTVAFIESGTNSPSLSTFLRICDALGEKPDLLLKNALDD